MRRTLRAAALTAAAIAFATAGGLAGPVDRRAGRRRSRRRSYTDHAGSALTAESLGLNDLLDPIPFGDVAAPVATHAVAPAAPQSILETDEAAEPETRSLADLVADYSGTETPDAETECLARAVYWESKGEPLAGQLTVAEVIINRARSGRFASTICGVVRQRGQFSFVRGGHIPQPPSGLARLADRGRDRPDRDAGPRRRRRAARACSSTPAGSARAGG